jgi:hypothetical protein
MRVNVKLNLPILEKLSNCNNILIAGMGGGFDVFCGLPIYFELINRGKKVHLANFSFSDITSLRDGVQLTPSLVGVSSDLKDIGIYFPEKYLSEWFREQQNSEIIIWCFQKTGVRPLFNNSHMLLDHLSIDGILLIDGGVDSLIQGDEKGVGTVVEDAISLYVVNEMDHIPVRILATVAFGAEKNISYNQIFENIALLTKAGAFQGVCALTPQMESYQSFENAVLFVQQQRGQEPSVINSSLISAVRGEFGNYHLTAKTKGSRLWISPLMTLYWFFDLPMVASHNKFLNFLKDTETFSDGVKQFMSFVSSTKKRKTDEIQL